MKIFKEERQRERHLEFEVEARNNAKAARNTKLAQTQMASGIDKFEVNLRRLGLTDGAKSEAAASHNDDDYINRIRARKLEEVAGRRERTKRRQKLLLDQQNVYIGIYDKQRQEQLLEKIMRQSKDERNLGQELEKQSQWKQVMVANRKFREAQYDERRRLDDEEHKDLTNHLREKENELLEARRAEELEKVQTVLAAKEKEKKAKRQRFCSDLCNDIFYIAWQVIDYREKTDSLNSTFGKKALVPDNLWKEWIFQFNEGACNISVADELPEHETLIGEIPEEPPADEAEAQPPAKRASVTGKRQSVVSKKEASEKDGSVTPESVVEAKTPTPPPPSEESLQLLRTLNKEEIKNYCWRTSDWATATTAPIKPFNEHICRILRDVNKVIHPDRAPFKRNDMSNFMLVLLTGKPLSGKSVVAKAVARDLNFSCVCIREIVSEALTGLSKGTVEVLQDITDAELKDLLSERMDLSRKAKDDLDSGHELSDESLSKLTVNYYKQLRRQAALSQSQSTDTNSTTATKGLILEGFPRTATQLKIIEEELTTYKQSVAENQRPKFELAPEDCIDERSCSRMSGLSAENGGQQAEQGNEVAAAADEAPADETSSKCPSGRQTPLEPVASFTDEELKLLDESTDPDESAFSLILSLEVSDAEISLRYAGERVDPVSGKKYHLKYNPPDDVTINRLLECDRTTCDMELLHSKLTQYRHHKKRIVSWLTGNSHDIHKNIDCEGLSLDEMTKLATEEVQRSIVLNEEIRNRQIQREEIRERHRQDELRYQQQQQERSEQRALKSADEAANYEKNTPVTATPDSLNTGGVLQTRPSVPISLSTDVAKIIIDQWEEMTHIFESGLTDAFIELRRLKFQTADHFILNTKQFKEILSKPTHRQGRISEFQTSFNDFDIELRRDPDGMAELHLKMDGLQQDLWKLADTRKEEALATLNDYQAAPWHLIFKQAVQSQFTTLIDLELTRFVFTKRIILFYYGAAYLVDLKISQDETIPDLSADKSEGDPKQAKGGAKAVKKPPPPQKQKTPDDEKEGEAVDEFQRSYQRAVEWIKEIVQEGMTEPEVNATLSDEDQIARMKAEKLSKMAWQREADLLTQRLEAICAKCYSFLDDVSDRATSVYKKLNGYLQNSYESEMKGISSLSSYVKEKIEQQLPLDICLDMQGPNLVIDTNTYYVLPSEQLHLQPKEQDDSDNLVTSVLTRQNLTDIIQRFRGKAPGGLISKDDVIRLFLQVAAYTDGEKWASHGKETFEKMFNTMDWLNKGTCDWRLLCLSILIWSQRADNEPQWVGSPSRKDIITLRDELFEKSSSPESKTVMLTEKQFLEVPFWFETPLPNVVQNQQLKATQIKEVIFDIFKTENDTVDVVQFLLYLCPDKQVLRGCQKAFSVVATEGGLLDKESVFQVFHYTPYTSSGEDTDESYSEESLSAIFDKASSTEDSPDGVSRLNFTQLCSWHIGRVMLNNATMYLERVVTF
eukprot:TRINITY_DN822_c4_g1_i1.p1 TRINITY_DN822_c4_g1~~TRINITY_DN822_c4_g1_i1.p1  ORF type:complete len:1584 (+),score=421.30 TRINITY_DN822_c4_g1_i1:327-4754(+)